MLQENIVNGVDVGTVKTTVNAIEEDATVAKFEFRAVDRWIEGGHSQMINNDYYGAHQEFNREKPFVQDADEPPLLAGRDLAPNPVEHLLNALASCLTTTMVYHAALRGIKLEEVEAELKGHIDLRGFLGLSNDVRRGYQDISVNFKVKTDEENLDRLVALSKLSPVFDVTSNGTDVNVSIERK